MTRGRRREVGAATAELAVALPALVLVLAVALAAVDLGVAQVRCVDAARTAARLVARGEVPGVAVSEARRAAPRDAVVTVSVDADRVTATVSSPVPRVLRPLGGVPEPMAVAVARLEGTPVEDG